MKSVAFPPSFQVIVIAALLSVCGALQQAVAQLPNLTISGTNQNVVLTGSETTGWRISWNRARI